MKGWLREHGVQVRQLDMTVAGDLAEAAWLELADLDVVPVLVLRDGEREVVRYPGVIPEPDELARVLDLERGC